MKAGTVRVLRALERVGSAWRFKEPKTARGRRAIPLPGDVLKALQEHRSEVLRRRLAAGSAWQDLDLVFPEDHGQPLEEHNLYQRNFKRALARAALPATLRLYDLRHTCATLLMEAGENPKVVSERMGHASVALMLDVYSHVTPGMQSGATAKLAGILFGSDG